MTIGDVSRGLNPDPVALRPAEPGRRLPFWPVFAADPAGVADLVEEIEQEGVVDLADIGLVAAGIAGDLYMFVAAGERADLMGQITLHDLNMIEVELEL